MALRRRVVGSMIAIASALTLYLLSIPAVSNVLALTVGDSHIVDLSKAREAKAIVVLAAGLSGDATEAAGVTLGPLTLERVRYAVRLAKELQLPIAVSGGVGMVGLTEADLMRNALRDEYRVQPRWVENLSRNTRENASFTASILRRDGIATVVLVTHPFDVRRARGAFEAEELKVIAAPAQVPPQSEHSARDFLPSIWALQVSHFCIYELMAQTRDRFRGP